MTALAAEIDLVRGRQGQLVVGTVAALRGLTLAVEALPLPVGSLVRVRGTQDKLGEIVGFDRGCAMVMLLEPATGVREGDRVCGEEVRQTVLVGERVLGRIVDGLGRPVDGKGAIELRRPAPLEPAPIGPMQRKRVLEPLYTGVRAIDTLLTLGKGQRIGVFAGPGVGKSTLMGAVAQRSKADVNVIALIGERGREVRDFVEAALGEEGLARSVVVAATSDQPPTLRTRAFRCACAIAEYFRDTPGNDGAPRDVMLMVDSVTRFAQAQRQIGLAVGEPPATKGYTPSVFAQLPALLERAGAVEGAGSITGVYTVLVEGDDMTEPIADAARGVLDGHIILSRDLARKGHYPAIDPLDSVSRVADDVCDTGTVAARRQVLSLLAAHKDVEDLVQVGAYAAGSNPRADVAIRMLPELHALLKQTAGDAAEPGEAFAQLGAIAMEAGAALGEAAVRGRGA